MLKKYLLPGFAILIFGILFVPFLIPDPPLDGTKPPIELADPDSKFVEINGLNVHYKERGGGRTAIILLHGFASSEYSWREVIEPLSQYGRVIAFDRPAFGLTDRPLEWDGESPYSAEYQPELVIELMNEFDIERAVLVGNSAGGTIAMNTYLAYPDRISGLVLVDPAVFTGGGTPGFIKPFLQTPQMDRIGPLIVRNIQNWGRSFAESAWNDPTKITDEVWFGYSRPLMVNNWDQALWQLTKNSQSSNLTDALDQFTLPVFVITGENDRIVPAEDSIRLASELPNAELTVIPDCGHVPHEECPQEFLSSIAEFMIRLQNQTEP
jgi:pimeloyl-ACP methyl ester carboxylesterase